MCLSPERIKSPGPFRLVSSSHVIFEALTLWTWLHQEQCSDLCGIKFLPVFTLINTSVWKYAPSAWIVKLCVVLIPGWLGFLAHLCSFSYLEKQSIFIFMMFLLCHLLYLTQLQRWQQVICVRKGHASKPAAMSNWWKLNYWQVFSCLYTLMLNFTARDGRTSLVCSHRKHWGTSSTKELTLFWPTSLENNHEGLGGGWFCEGL